MNWEHILDYGRRCQNAKYTTVENNADYAIERDGDTVYLLFEWSDGKVDWKNNFDFPAKAYKDMGITWRCHRGFLKVWKSIEPYIKDVVLDPTVKKFIVIGYSHGAAIATFAHEYVWFNRPDVRENGLEGYGFGCPRCYWGFRVKKNLRERWANFHPVRNADDIVTYVPPAWLGFVHVNDVIEVDSGTGNVFDAHYWSEYEKGINNTK